MGCAHGGWWQGTSAPSRWEGRRESSGPRLGVIGVPKSAWPRGSRPNSHPVPLRQVQGNQGRRAQGLLPGHLSHLQVPDWLEGHREQQMPLYAILCPGFAPP